MTQENQSVGREGELLACSALSMLGVENVQRIGPRVNLSPYVQYGRNIQGVFRVHFSERIDGDITGLAPGGIFVLAEVKTYDSDRLPWSALTKTSKGKAHVKWHQSDALYRHIAHGGIALLVWVHHSGIYIMRWPVPNFDAGKSIDVQTAAKLNLERI